MRVLHVSRWIGATGGGGVQAYLRAAVSSLESFGVQSDVAALLAPFSDAPEHCVYYGVDGISKVRNAWRLHQWLSANVRAYNVVHVHGVTDWHFWVASITCKRAGVPLVASTHGGLQPGMLAQIRRLRLVKARSLRGLASICFRWTACVLVSSELEKCSVRSVSQRVEVRAIPPMVDTPVETPVSYACSAQDRIRMLFLGRLDPVKSLETVLEAMAVVADRRLTLLVAGSGAPGYVQSLARKATQLGLDAQVHFAGYVAADEKEQVFNSSDILVLPSLSESFGMVAAEAMARSLPVIASDESGISEYVVACGAGAVFEAGNVEALASILNQMLNKRFELAEMGLSGRAWVSSHLGSGYVGRRLCDVYEKAASLFTSRLRR